MEQQAFAYTLPHSLVPVLPLRDVVVFPHMVVPLFVGRDASIKALEASPKFRDGFSYVALFTQKNFELENPEPEDLNKIGVFARILQIMRMPDGTFKLLVEGIERIYAKDYQQFDGFLSAYIESFPMQEGEAHIMQAYGEVLLRRFEEMARLNRKIQVEMVRKAAGKVSTLRLADNVMSVLSLSLEDKQAMLNLEAVEPYVLQLVESIEKEIALLQIESKIHEKVNKQIERNQREYYLQEQVKAIHRELNDGDENADLEALQERITQAKMPKAVQEKAQSEWRKLKQMAPMSAEATVVRSYLETLLDLPWHKKSIISKNLNKAEGVLNQDHYGLDKVKDRILEYLAVQQRVNKLKAPILCFVGPPGVGKTSLGQSIAKATNRQYVRMALGGVRDESEIRGHRRTYIGALPGKILQNMSKVGVRNPLFLLDEIDKMGADFRGDPASALLEVLDPEQNHTFQDHYLEVDYDLSDVMFVATSNSLNIPPALLDRMEIIRLSGYTEDEKMHIAQDYLVPKQLRQNGLKTSELSIAPDALLDIIRYYTREAGVRGLEREIGKICRKVVRNHVSQYKKGTISSQQVSSQDLAQYLGVRKYSFGLAEKGNQVGQVNGLAWTEVGGDLLTIEVAVMPGKGLLQHTGSLGDVMKESMAAAKTVIRSRAHDLGLEDALFDKRDIHIHVPDGATPKDGPSAGIAITTALVSAFTNIPIRADVAMTGEVTLRGEVLEIGGLKEKLLAALRAGIRTVLIPHDNLKDLAEIPENVKNTLEIIPVRWIEEVLNVALERQPTPLSEERIAQIKQALQATLYSSTEATRPQ